MPAISIIIPIYNAALYLEKAIQCSLAQTMVDFELILVDDGSTDNSLDICFAFAMVDTRITVISKRNEGAGSARNCGMNIASGAYLAFPDADDWFTLDIYEQLHALAQKSDADLVLGGFWAVAFDQNGQELSRCETPCKQVFYQNQEECRNHIMDLFPTTALFDVPWNKLYRRKTIMDNNVRFSDIRRCQDALFNLDYYHYVRRVITTPNAYYFYRENTQEKVWRKFPVNYIDAQITYHNRLKELFQLWGIYLGDIKQHYEKSFIISIRSTLDFCFNPYWHMNRKEKERYIQDIVFKKEVLCYFEAIPASAAAGYASFRALVLQKDYRAIANLVIYEHRIKACKEVLYKYLPNSFLKPLKAIKSWLRR